MQKAPRLCGFTGTHSMVSTDIMALGFDTADTWTRAANGASSTCQRQQNSAAVQAVRGAAVQAVRGAAAI
jgi:hypothetical protein